MVQFNEPFATALLLWVFWSLYRVAHRSPFGLWTSAQRTWYLKIRKRLGWGPRPAAAGIYMLIMYPLLGLGQAWYHVTFQTCNIGLYPATTIVAIVAIAIEKVWCDLMWDRRDGDAAFWVLVILHIPLLIAWITLVAVTDECPAIGDGWTRWYLIGVLGVVTVSALYHAAGMWLWSQDPLREVGNLTRKEQRTRQDIKAQLRQSVLK